MTAKLDNNRSGVVFDIQRYSIHDGPGIRTVVFLKGCPLQCRWCANPESLGVHPQLFYSKSKCIHCGLCTKAAPEGTVYITKAGELEIDFETLNAGEADWVSVCPTGAMGLKGKQLWVDEVFDTVMRDEAFYRQSGGGITLSGGEPLVQVEFAKSLLQMAQDEVLSTALETTGLVPWPHLQDVLPLVDLFLFDLKHLDTAVHREYTGAGNEQILENLARLAQSGANIMVRQPLIPGVNDDKNYISRVLAYLAKLGINKYSLLPFHQYGSGKYAGIGRVYSMQQLAPPPAQRVDELKEMVAEAGFTDQY